MNYRTTPPPRHATEAELIAWAVEEGRHWPPTPMFYYTWWMARVGPATRQPARPKQDTPAPAAVQLELF